jgi:hypothetical protein
MSRKAAIFYAMSAQLAALGKDPPNLANTLRQALGVGADTDVTLQQNRNTARTFVATVAVRLRSDEPALNFKWSAIADNALDDILWLVVDRIDENTESVEDTPKKAS